MSVQFQSSNPSFRILGFKVLARALTLDPNSPQGQLRRAAGPLPHLALGQGARLGSCHVPLAASGLKVLSLACRGSSSSGRPDVHAAEAESCSNTGYEGYYMLLDICH